MRKGPVIVIGIAIIMAIGIGVGHTFTDSINFDMIPSNDQDNSMQMSDDVKLTISSPNEETVTEKQADVGSVEDNN